MKTRRRVAKKKHVRRRMHRPFETEDDDDEEDRYEDCAFGGELDARVTQTEK
jgi:hypothetical protein